MLKKNSQPKKSEPEAEMETLRERVEQLEAKLKKERPSVLPEEKKKVKEKAVKQEIKNYLRELQQTPPFAAPPAARDEAREIAKLPPNQQVGSLVSLVFEKGLKKAISVARALGNPAILDEFHDILVDRYYKELIKKEIIKE